MQDDLKDDDLQGWLQALIDDHSDGQRRLVFLDWLEDRDDRRRECLRVYLCVDAVAATYQPNVYRRCTTVEPGWKALLMPRFNAGALAVLWFTLCVRHLPLSRSAGRRRPAWFDPASGSLLGLMTPPFRRLVARAELEMMRFVVRAEDSLVAEAKTLQRQDYVRTLLRRGDADVRSPHFGDALVSLLESGTDTGLRWLPWLVARAAGCNSDDNQAGYATRNWMNGMATVLASAVDAADPALWHRDSYGQEVLHAGPAFAELAFPAPE